METIDVKTCKRCKTIYPISGFSKNKSKRDGLQVSCKKCVKEINSSYYKRTPERNADRAASKLRVQREAKEYVWDILVSSACVDCGNDNPMVLEFDHVRGEKQNNVSYLMGGGYSINTIQKEIDKCEVRCANCHRIVTAERAGTWRVLLST